MSNVFISEIEFRMGSQFSYIYIYFKKKLTHEISEYHNKINKF